MATPKNYAYRYGAIEAVVQRLLRKLKTADTIAEVRAIVGTAEVQIEEVERGAKRFEASDERLSVQVQHEDEV